MVGFRRSEVGDSAGTFAQRLILNVREKHPALLFVVSLVHITAEVLDLCIYAWSQYRAVCTDGLCWQSGDLADADMQITVFYVQSVLHLWFIGGWGAMMWASPEKAGFFFSRWSLVTLLTSVSVLVFSIASFFEVSWSFHIVTNADGSREGRFPWIPTFLRIWTFYDTTVFVINFWRVVSATSATVIEMVLSLVSTMVTCLCFFQASQSYFSASQSLFDSMYFAVVTFGTIGFGDIEPDDVIPRQVTVIILVVAVYTFPAFFSNLAAVARTMSLGSAYSSHSGRRRHVIFAGDLSSRDINYFINEFCGGLRRFDNVHLVIMAKQEYSQEMRMRVKAPALDKRVTLMVGDVQRRADLDRADAKYADGIFIANSDDLAAGAVDADVILRTTSVFQYDRNLPQHVVMRRERNVPLVRGNNVHNILEKERLKYSLLGMGVIAGGAIPLIINLVRSYDSDADAHQARTWQEQTEWSMGNELYSFAPPESAIGSSFLYTAFLYRHAVVSVIGVVATDGSILLNPKGYVVTADTRLLAMAADEQVITARTEEIDRDPKLAWEELQLPRTIEAELNRPSTGKGGTRARVKRKKEQDEPVILLTPFNTDVLGGLQGHVVLIDLHSAQREENTSPQAESDMELFRATDLFNVMRSIKLQDASVPILLLSRGVLHPSFGERWRATEYEPIYHLDGCGLSQDDLVAARVYVARGALIFSTAESSDPNADTMTMLVNANIDAVCTELAAPDHAVNVVSDIKHMDSLTLVPPYYSSDRMTELAADNFAFEPAFVVGRLISGSMLDSALYQTYFNSEVLRTVDAFIYGDGRTASVSSMPVPQDCRTYRDVEVQCARLGYLPVALYRLLEDPENTELDGHRFLFVNPPSECTIRTKDAVYFLH